MADNSVHFHLKDILGGLSRRAGEEEAAVNLPILRAAFKEAERELSEKAKRVSPEEAKRLGVPLLTVKQFIEHTLAPEAWLLLNCDNVLAKYPYELAPIADHIRRAQKEVFGNQKKTLARVRQAKATQQFAMEHTLGRACGITWEELEELALQVGMGCAPTNHRARDEVVRLHREGWTEILVKEICEKWPEEAANLGFTHKADAKTKPMLSKNASLVYELLLGLPVHRGMTGTEICNALMNDQHVNMDESTLRKNIVPALEPYGIEHVPRIGYRIRPDKRPTS